MRIQSLAAASLRIPFKAAFRHASAERGATQSLWITARATDGSTGVGEGCPREYVTGESLETAHAFVAGHREEWLASIDGMASLVCWVQANEARIDLHPAAWCAVELAFLDLFAKRQRETIEQVLGLPPLAGPYRYSAVIGDGSQAAFEKQLAAYRGAGFHDFKIKLSGDRRHDLGKVRALDTAGVSPACVRADANNLWGDWESAAEHLASLDFAFRAVEEPLAAQDFDGMRALGHALDVPIILDESAVREADLAVAGADSDRWIVNLRVSKMGGLLRSARFVRRARAMGIRLVVGAHVGETSVLTRAGLTIAEAARDLLVAQEGAFGTHLLERDPVEPCVMFGRGGVLDLATPPPPGHGLGFALPKHGSSDPRHPIPRTTSAKSPRRARIGSA